MNNVEKPLPSFIRLSAVVVTDVVGLVDGKRFPCLPQFDQIRQHVATFHTASNNGGYLIPRPVFDSLRTVVKGTLGDAWLSHAGYLQISELQKLSANLEAIHEYDVFQSKGHAYDDVRSPLRHTI